MNTPLPSATAGTCPFGYQAEQPERPATDAPSGVDREGLTLGIEAPVADWVDRKAMMADPYPTYERLRAESPVAWVPALNKYLVTSYAGCHEVEMDQEIFSANVSGATMNRAIGAQPMLRKDDPDHAADRAAINPTLRPKNIKETWAPAFERNARRYLEVLAEKAPARRSSTGTTPRRWHPKT